MMSQKEQRKLWWLGLPPSSWVTILTVIFTTLSVGASGAISYARAMDRVEANTEGRKAIKRELTAQIKAIEKRLTILMSSTEGRLTANMRENRQVTQKILFLLNENNK